MPGGCRQSAREMVSVSLFVGGVIFGCVVMGRFYILSRSVYVIDLGFVSFMRTAVGVFVHAIFSSL